MSNFETAIDATLDDLAEVEAQIEALEARKLSLRRNLAQALAETDQRNLRRPAGAVSLQIGKASLKVIDRDAIPDTLMRVKVEPDKERIVELVHYGQTVPGVEVSFGEPYVQIKWSAAAREAARG